jgi:multicomponent Na+:H+ antiporter subunit G
MRVDEWISAAVMGVGAIFFLAGTVGLLRFPDALTRLHALTKADNLGLGLIAAGLALQAGSWVVVVKLVFIWLLVLLGSATVSSMIGTRVREQLRDDGRRA